MAPLLYTLPHALQGIYLHLLGCKMADVIDYCDRESAVGFNALPLFAKLGELLKIGTGVFINGDEVLCHYNDPVTGQAYYHEVTFGDNVYLGGNSCVGMGVEFEAYSGVGGRSCVYPFTVVKEGTMSVGNKGQFIMKRPASDDSKDRLHGKDTPLFWKVMYMLKHLKAGLHVVFPQVVFKTSIFQSIVMLERYFDSSSVLGSLLCAYGAYIITIFVMVVITVVASRTYYKIPKEMLRGKSARVNSDEYRAWIHYSVMMVTVRLSVLTFIGSSPLYTFFLRFMGAEVGENFVQDNTWAELHECQNTVIGDNVVMNNFSVVSPHTILMDNSVKLLHVKIDDRTSLLPRSGVYGGVHLSPGVLLGSHCRPFCGQNLHVRDAEYNDTPSIEFVKVKEGQNHVSGGSFSDREPLTKSQAIEIVQEALASILEGKHGLSSSSKPADSTGREEIQLDSMELVEFSAQLNKKFHANITVDTLLDLGTVSDVAGAFLADELELPKGEEVTDKLDFDIGIGFEYISHKTAQGNN